MEDDDDIAEFLRAYFRASGYDLVRIDPLSAKEVVDAVDEHTPDLVLLDYRLRGFSGHEAYRLLRAQDRFAFVPVIVVTNLTTIRGGPKQQIGYTIDDLRVESVVTITPDTAGRFVAICDNFCGSGHGNMKMIINVE